MYSIFRGFRVRTLSFENPRIILKFELLIDGKF